MIGGERQAVRYWDKRNTNKWNAEDYAKHSTAQWEWANELIGKLRLKGDESLLDIGCGDGKITRLLAERLPDGTVVGIDASEEMIALASRSHTQGNLSFRLMDAADIRLEHPFDVAFSNAALHWIRDHAAVLRGVKAHLNPGGRILFQMGGRGNTLNMHEVVMEIIRCGAWSAYFEGFEYPYFFYHPTDYERWLPEAGFEAVRVERVPKDMVHENPDALKGWLRTTWFPFTDRLPESMRNGFLNEVVDAFLTRHPVDERGRTHVNMVRLEVEAVAENGEGLNSNPKMRSEK